MIQFQDCNMTGCEDADFTGIISVDGKKTLAADALLCS